MAKSQLQQLKPDELEYGATGSGSCDQEDDQDDESDHPATPTRPHRRAHSKPYSATPAVSPQPSHIRPLSMPSSAQQPLTSSYPTTPTRTPTRTARPASSIGYYTAPHSPAPHTSGAFSMPSTRASTPITRYTPMGAAQPSSMLAHHGEVITTPTSSSSNVDLSAYMLTPDSATAQRYAGAQQRAYLPQLQLFAEENSRKSSLSSDIYGITELDAWTPLFNFDVSAAAELDLV